MAELDLKAIWKKGESRLSKDQGVDFEKAIGKKSNTILQKVKFILSIEFWLNNALTLPAAIIYYQTYGASWGIFAGGVFLIYFFYYLFLIRAIKNFDYSGDVKNSLTKIYRYLKFYILHYKVMIWGCFVGIPYFALGYGIYVGYNGIENPALMPENAPKFEFTQTEAYIVLAALIIVPIVVAVLFHFLVGLLYESRLKKLKRVINDLN